MKHRHYYFLIAICCLVFAGCERSAISPSSVHNNVDVGVYRCSIESIEQVYDGDTIVDVLIEITETASGVFSQTGEVFPNIVLTDAGVYVQNGIRISGIDTPEIRPSTKKRDGTPRTQASRDKEKHLAIQARDAVRQLISDNDLRFTVRNVEMDKYGRILADVSVGGVDVGAYLIEQGYARVYDGGTREDWE